MTTKPVKPSDKAATFTVTLPKGPTRLHTWLALRVEPTALSAARTMSM